MEIKRILSLVIFAATVIIHGRHVWGAFNPPPNLGEQLERVDMTITSALFVYVPSAVSLLLLLFRKTFVAGNAILATMLFTLALIQLKVGIIKGALIEIPLIAMPILMIYLGYPLQNIFKNNINEKQQ